MKHILFVNQTSEYGGTERHLVDLVRRLSGETECTIICVAGDFISQVLAGNSSVRIVAHPRIQKHQFFSYWRLFRKWQPQIVVLVKGIPDLFPTSAYLAARLSGPIRLVVIEHLISDPLPRLVLGQGVMNRLRQLCGWRTRYLWSKKVQNAMSHATICVSEAIRKRLVDEQGYHPDRTITIHNGTDVQHFSSVAKVGNCHVGTVPASGSVSLVCVARLSQVKRIDLLLDALALLAQAHTSWRCALVGGGPLEQELRAQTRKLGLDSLVRFEGHVEDVRPFLAGADVFVLPSDKEGLPLSVAEAMAMGIPCVATDVGGTAEIVVHGRTGLLVKPGSSKDLRDALEYMIVHHEERRRMGMQAGKWVAAHFDMEQAMAKVCAVVVGQGILVQSSGAKSL